MALGILGKKIGMTQLFCPKGNVIPATIIKVTPCFITDIKSISENNNIIQIGYNKLELTSKKLSKPMRGYFNKKNVSPFQHLKEYKVNNINDFHIGQELNLDIFKTGQKIIVSGLTIGKGNASNIKRNNFGRGPMSHGSKHHRLQGSLGAGTTPGRVFPGKKMPGRLGTEKCTIKNLEIIYIDNKNSILILKGSVPGKKTNLLDLKSI